MKVISKYDGKLPRICHSPADFAVARTSFPISAACRASGDSTPDCMILTLSDGKKFTMSPCDSFSSDVGQFEIYRADLPASELWGTELKYTISAKDDEKENCGPFTVPLIAADEFPALPPLVITELFVRPKGPGVTGYMEVMNPGSENVDLYDYEVLVFPKTTKAEGKPAGRLPLASSAGESVLHGGEFAALWPIRSRNFGVEIDGVKRDIVTVQDFCDVFNKDFFYTSLGLTPDGCRIIPVQYTEVDPETGTRLDIKGICDLPEKHTPTVLLIVPRGKKADDAVFTMVYSTNYSRWDTPVKRSSYWKIDVRDPAHAVNISHADFATPGYAGRGQAVPDVRAAMPVIIPLSPDKEVYIGQGDCKINFAVIQADPCRPVTDADVHIFLKDGFEQVFPAYEDEKNGNYSAVIPAETVETLDTLEYFITASDGTRRVSIFADSQIRIPVYDNAGPRITDIYPTKYYSYDGTEGKTPVWAEYYDKSGVRLSDCRMWIDGKDVTAKADWSDLRVEYSPAKPLEPGNHKLSLRLFDELDNKTECVIPFFVSDMEDLQVYRGEVHSHTSDSDGTGFPTDAINYARQVGGADYFAVTDHSHYISPEVYSGQVRTADKLDDPGKFAVIYGWEMTWNNTCGLWGHLNVLNSRCIVNNILKNDLPQMYRWLGSHPEAVAMFNHPCYRWGNFDEFAHKTPEADNSVCLAEIKGASWEREYVHMLSRGWHAAPVSNEDNHAANWTTATTSTGCVLAPSLTRQNIIDAFRARRTYTTSDPSMKIRYRVNGKWLGSRIKADDRLRFDISVTTEREEGIGLVEIVAEDNIVVASRNVGILRSLQWNPVLRPDFDYYYVRITSRDQFTATAPVWIEDRPAPDVLTMEYAASYKEDLPAAVTVSVSNPTEETMTDVRVSFILSRHDGFRYGETEPFCTVCCGKLGAGAALNCSRELPEISGMRRVTAIVRAKLGGRIVTATKYILISSVTITEVMPSTQPFIRNDGTRINNPFSYITIYNSSPRDVDLTGGKLGLSTETGKNALPARVWQTDGVKIPARSAVVIWDKTDACAELSVDDFNRRYKTHFKEGVDLFAADKHILSSLPDGRRLELAFNGETVSRVMWNWGAECDGQSHIGEAHRYVYRPNMTITSTPVGFGIPAPGIIDAEQMGRQLSAAPEKKEIKREKKARRSDIKQELRNERVSVTKKETAVIAGSVAAAAAAAGALITVLIKGKRK